MKMKTKKIAAGAVLLLLAGTVSGCGKTEIDAMEKLDVSFSGVDGYGTASVTNKYDWEEEVLEAIGGDDPDDVSLLGDMMKIESAVSYEIFPDEGLSNGDTVTVKVTADNETVKEYKIAFKAGEKEFTVGGLKEVEQLDLFETVDVEFEGFAPYVKASIKKGNSSVPVYVSYSLDKTENLTVGDVVTVTAEYDENQLLEQGYTVKDGMKEYAVPECDRYAAQLAQIPSDTMGKMQGQIEDAIRAKGGDELTGMEYIGSYFLSLKPGMDGKCYNAVYVLYKVEETDVENPDEIVQYYTYGRFEDLIILKDGTCSVNLSKYKLPEGSAFSKNIYSGDIFWRGRYYYVGFEDMDTMFHRCVTENMENYEYESDVTGE